MGLIDRTSDSISPKTVWKMGITPPQASNKLSFWSKIGQFVSHLFSSLCFWSQKKASLSEHQISLIENVKKDFAKPGKKTLGERKVQDIQLSDIERDSIPPKKFDPSLENMRDFLHDFVGVVIQSSYEKYLEEALHSLQETAQGAPEGLKALAKWVISLEKTSKPLFAKLKEKKVDEFISALQHLLNFLKQGDAKALKEQMEKELAKRLSVKDAPKNSTQSTNLLFAWLFKTNPSAPVDPKKHIEQCSDAVLYWLLETNQSESLETILEKKGINTSSDETKELIQVIFETSIYILVENKINQCTQKINETIQDKLPDIVQATLQKNALKLTDILSARLAELISNLGNEKYKDTFDGIVEKVNNQAAGYALAKKKSKEPLKEHKRLIREAQKIVTIQPRTPQEAETIAKYQEYLDNVQRLGGYKGIKERTILQQFAQLEESVCHKTTQNIVNDDLISSDTEEARKGKERLLFEEMADNIIELMFPSKNVRVQNKIQKVDGFVSLVQEIEFPEELASLLKEADGICRAILTPDSYKQTENGAKAIKEFVEVVAPPFAKQIAREKIAYAIQTVFNMLSKPEQLNELVVENVLPSLKENMVETFTRQIFATKTHEIAPLFSDLVNSFEKKENPYAEIQKRLYDLLKKECKEFSIESEISKDKFDNLITPFIQEIEKTLRVVKQGTEGRYHKMTSEETELVIQQFFADHVQDDQPLFADLIMNIVFKIGNFGAFTEKLAGFQFVQRIISTTIATSLHQFRTSHHALIDKTFNTLRPNYLNKEKVLNLISLDEPIESLQSQKESLEKEIARLNATEEKNAEKFEKLNLQLKQLDSKIAQAQEKKARIPQKNKEIKQELLSQINKIAQLSHDLTMFNAKKKGRIAKFFAKKIIGNDASHLNNVITKCYDQLLGNQLLTENLLFQIQEVFLGALNKTSNQLDYEMEFDNKTKRNCVIL